MTVNGSFRSRIGCHVRQLAGIFLYRELQNSGPIVLAYHGVVERLQPGCLDQFSIDRFTLLKHLRFLNKKRKIISVDDFFACLSSGEKIDPRWVILTFDDALKSQVTLGAEVLATANVPWALSVPVGLVSTSRTVWTYEVRFILSQLWSRDCVSIPGSGEQKISLASINQRAAAADVIINRLMHHVHESDRNRYIEGLRLAVGIDRLTEALHDDGRFTMASWSEIQHVKSQNVTFLSHGWLHRPQNATIDETTCIQELQKSKLVLWEKTGVLPLAFVLPNGVADAASRSRIRAAGYKFCFSSRAARVQHQSDPFDLPRIDAEYTLPVLRHHILKSIR